MFLRVGGTAWELNFDTKRDQYKKNRYLEYDSEKGNDKNIQLWQDDVQTTSFNLTSFFCFLKSWPWLDGGSAGDAAVPACLDASRFSHVNNTI